MSRPQTITFNKRIVYRLAGRQAIGPYGSQNPYNIELEVPVADQLTVDQRKSIDKWVGEQVALLADNLESHMANYPFPCELCLEPWSITHVCLGEVKFGEVK